jgi:alanyl-tRNA synthetase
MESAEIRRRWLEFFGDRGHEIVPSASLIADDPTLLLVNAGMVPFKPYFLGEAPPPWPRATSIQKCVRTLDIDEVGKTTRHASFFQMCGNFSFGDYFKAGAIPLAWELLTKPIADGGFGFPEERMWVTVYTDDDEAADIWHRTVGLPMERIQRRGVKDNYWHMGVPGPGGPCSEIYYDRGPEYGREGGPIVDEERFLEVWNLVFMQDVLGAVRAKEDFDIVGELPAKNIDTGLGLERLAAILQGVDNIYEIDTTRTILDRAAELTGKRYHADPTDDVRLRVVADHTRTAVMLIGDGVTPGNEGRGYVLRRIMRRVIRSMRLLGADGRTLAALVDSTITAMGPQYPELIADAARIYGVAEAEEEAFLATLRTGTALFDTAVSEVRSGGGSTLSGDRAFQLHDTFGFPIDLTLEMAAEAGLQVDADGFKRLMSEQRTRAKADAVAKRTGHGDVGTYRSLAEGGPAIVFLGYEQETAEASVRGLLVDGLPASEAAEGAEVDVVLDRTPFYAEGGGQLSDSGTIRLAGGGVVEVRDVQAPVPGLIVHRGVVRIGGVHTGEAAEAGIDRSRRQAISRSHTATHMVHKAFREALGETATQAGSENAPGRFRFDFAATGAVPAAVLHDVEVRVNDLLAEDLAVTAEVMSLDDARRSGAMALFGEKYGEAVRVVSVGDWARELCGGTHVRRSSQLGLVKLLGEASIGAGVRRVEALVGVDAYRFLAREHLLVAQLSDMLKARPEDLPERVAGALERLKDAERDLQRFRSAQVLAGVDEAVASAAAVGRFVVVSRAVEGVAADDLRRFVVAVRDRLSGDAGVVAVTSVADGKPLLIVATTPAARESGAKAGALVRAGSAVLGGGGGGKDDLAQGGGTDPAAATAALDRILADLAALD